MALALSSAHTGFFALCAVQTRALAPIHTGPSAWGALSEVSGATTAGSVSPQAGRNASSLDTLPPETFDLELLRLRPSQLAAGGLCLDLAGGDTSNGNTVEARRCGVGLASQLWQLSGQQIRFGADGSKCLDAGLEEASSQATIWDCNGLGQQNWGRDAGSGSVYLERADAAGTLADSSLCLSLDEEAVDGTPVKVASCSATWEQQWIPLRAVTLQVQAQRNLCLEVLGDGTDNGTPIKLSRCDGSLKQMWSLDDEGRSLRLAGDTQKCLDFGDMQDGSAVWLWDCNGSEQQMLRVDAEMGIIHLDTSSAKSQKCVSLPDGFAEAEVPLQVWPCNTFSTDQFLAVSISNARKEGQDESDSPQDGDTVPEFGGAWSFVETAASSANVAHLTMPRSLEADEHKERTFLTNVTSRVPHRLIEVAQADA